MKNRIVGLTEEQVKLSREKYGANVFEKVKKKGFFGKFIENLSDPIIKILLIALVVQVVFTLGRVNYFEVGGILAAILIAATVSTLSELGSEAAFSRMEAENTDVKIKVLRDGEIKLLLLSQIVVGDVVYIASGDKIPADGIMIEVHNDPMHALCDGAQSLTPEQFDKLAKKIFAVREVALS